MKRRATTSATPLPTDHVELMWRVKARIATAQTRAALAANRELLRLYWTIGRDLVGNDGRNDYGTRAVEWQTKLVASLPKELAGSLLTVEQIEKELRR